MCLLWAGTEHGQRRIARGLRMRRLDEWLGVFSAKVRKVRTSAIELWESAWVWVGVKPAQ